MTSAQPATDLPEWITKRSPAKCKHCGMEIIWCETVNGKRMALDATPIQLPDGAQFVLSSRNVAHSTAGWAFTCHYAHCPGG